LGGNRAATLRVLLGASVCLSSMRLAVEPIKLDVRGSDVVEIEGRR
jgi:hypothetical protein